MKWSRNDIYSALKEDYPNEYMSTYKEFCAAVFFHPGGKALRLRFSGLDTLSKHYPHYDVEILDTTQNRKNMPSKHYVFLTRYCKAPYYIGMNTIVFFDEDEALIFKLCDGDIDNVETVAK